MPPTALVAGGGVAGLTVAAELAGQGIEVWLAEGESSVGGQLRQEAASASDSVRADLLSSLEQTVTASDRIHLLAGSEVLRTEGHLGAFRSSLATEAATWTVEHGIVVLATGVQEDRPDRYLLGRHPSVMALSELERKLVEDSSWPGRHPRVAMILCAGSLEDGPGYCSRSCCGQAIADALRLKKNSPSASVYVLHREMRSYGFQETWYEQARREGVVFLRYDVGREPQLEPMGDALEITVVESDLGLPVVLEVDAVALAVGVRPRDVLGLSSSLGVARDDNGFFVEANVKTRSAEARIPGVFLAGACQAPRSLAETVTHARAAAMRVTALLHTGSVVTPPTLATVNERICSGCGLCVGACAYGARILDVERNVSTVTEILCQGCGACAAVCPSGATRQQGFAGDQMLAVLDAAVD